MLGAAKAVAWGACALANWNQKTLPSPAVLAKPIWPPINSTSPFANHQADTGAFFAVVVLPQAVEGLKQLSQLMGREPGARVRAR